MELEIRAKLKMVYIEGRCGAPEIIHNIEGLPFMAVEDINDQEGLNPEPDEDGYYIFAIYPRGFADMENLLSIIPENQILATKFF